MKEVLMYQCEGCGELHHSKKVIEKCNKCGEEVCYDCGYFTYDEDDNELLLCIDCYNKEVDQWNMEQLDNEE